MTKNRTVSTSIFYCLIMFNSLDNTGEEATMPLHNTTNQDNDDHNNNKRGGCYHTCNNNQNRKRDRVKFKSETPDMSGHVFQTFDKTNDKQQMTVQ